MATKLDLGLDDIIKQNKKGGKGGRGGNRGGNRGGSGFRGRGGNKPNRGGNRPGGIKRLNSGSPIKNRGLGGGKWQHDKAGANGVSSAPAGPVRLAVSNLDFGVNDQDVNELFSRCGNIVKACIHYDANGRSQGTAEVVYRSHKEALAAVNEYNGRLLDGRAMNVQIVGGAPKPVSLASRIGGSVGGNRGGFNRNKRGGARSSFGGGAQRGRGGARRGGAGGRGGRGGRKPGAPVSKEDLDKQMEEYRMQTDTA